uniref:Uncharacterized protein n=1 Tax=Rhizochromulina marina TaxID=1034831 RepID=A0A7S2SWP8_9STRA
MPSSPRSASWSSSSASQPLRSILKNTNSDSDERRGQGKVHKTLATPSAGLGSMILRSFSSSFSSHNLSSNSMTLAGSGNSLLDEATAAELSGPSPKAGNRGRALSPRRSRGRTSRATTQSPRHYSPSPVRRPTAAPLKKDRRDPVRSRAKSPLKGWKPRSGGKAEGGEGADAERSPGIVPRPGKKGSVSSTGALDEANKHVGFARVQVQECEQQVVKDEDGKLLLTMAYRPTLELIRNVSSFEEKRRKEGRKSFRSFGTQAMSEDEIKMAVIAGKATFLNANSLEQPPDSDSEAERRERRRVTRGLRPIASFRNSKGEEQEDGSDEEVFVVEPANSSGTIVSPHHKQETGLVLFLHSIHPECTMYEELLLDMDVQRPYDLVAKNIAIDDLVQSGVRWGYARKMIQAAKALPPLPPSPAHHHHHSHSGHHHHLHRARGPRSTEAAAAAADGGDPANQDGAAAAAAQEGEERREEQVDSFGSLGNLMDFGARLFNFANTES